MRSFKSVGIALAALLAISLAGCATPNFTNASDVACADVSAQIATAEAKVKTADDAVKANQGNLGAATASSDKSTAESELSALKERQSACENGGTPTPDAMGSCLAQFTQVSLSHEGNQVDDQNRAKYEAAVANVANLSDAQRDFFIAETGNSAWKLAIWSHALGLHADPNDWTTLLTEDKTCLNEAGKELWYSSKGAVSAKGVTFEEAQAPENAWNSGVHGETYGTSADQGVRGDRTAIKITLANGTVAYILIRCGNPVYPGKPPLPEVPTDNPPPPTPSEKNINDAPQRQGNLPTQQMPNELPAAPEYAQPAEPASPPSTYVPPASAPEPAPPASQPSQPTPVPTKDPAPAPAPRPSAPTSDAPETGYDPSAP